MSCSSHQNASFAESFADAPQSVRLSKVVGLAQPPRPRDATASAFARWVYDVETGGRGTYPVSKTSQVQERRMTEGRFAHRDIERFALWYQRDHPRSFVESDWVVEFADPHDDSGPEKLFLASALRVRGEPLRCVPDVVLRNDRNGEVLIIERKTTMAEARRVPESGWPRLEAQLWCYGWIDDWLDAPEVYLVAQIWTRRSRGPGHYQMTWAKPRWRRSDWGFHRNWCEVFTLYGGTITAPALSRWQERNDSPGHQP